MDLQTCLKAVARANRRYPIEAYQFVLHGLKRAAMTVHGPLQKCRTARTRPRHVTGAQLCEALRNLAVDRWGPLAIDVLRRWGIRRTRDFGEIVFTLVDHQLLGRQPSDQIEDFDDVFAFDEAFNAIDIVTAHAVK